jgi:hypothetical protein
MSESRPTSSGNGTVDSIVRLVQHINLGGLPAVAWTLVVCVALWKQDGATLKWLWPELLRVWTILVGFWVVYTWGAMIVEALRKRRELVPVVAHAVPRIPSADAEQIVTERAANG